MFLTIITIVACGLVVYILAVLAKRQSKMATNENPGRYINNDDGFRFNPKKGIYVTLVIFIILMTVNSLVIVKDRTVKIPKLFGKYKEISLSPGIHFLNPLYDYKTMGTGHEAVNVSDGDDVPGMKCTTKDENYLDLQVNFSYRVNPKLAWWVIKNIGDDEMLMSTIIQPKATSATREAVPLFNLQECLVTKRQELQSQLRDKFAENIAESFEKQGLSKEMAMQVINILPVDLQSSLPDPKVQNALAEKKAAEIDLERQKTLTSIAQEVSNRREKEGEGIYRLFEELPKGFTSNDIALIMNSVSENKKADAFVKLSEEGKVTSIVFEGNAARAK